MECSLASNSSVSSNCIPGVKSDKAVKTGLRVNFTEKGEVKERREKFLTAKYGSHQMNLIRKRLAVEMWLYEELQKLSTAADVQKRIVRPSKALVAEEEFNSTDDLNNWQGIVSRLPLMRKLRTRKLGLYIGNADYL